jgi:hypothetical protein
MNRSSTSVMSGLAVEMKDYLNDAKFVMDSAANVKNGG